MADGLKILAPLVGGNGGEPRDGTPRVPADVVRRFIENGLGPMLHELATRGSITVDPASASNLAGCDLAAIAIHGRMVASVGQVLKSLNELGIRPVLLKGACFAPRYYRKAHWRAMGDVDLLVPSRDLERTDRTLRKGGFYNPSDKPSSAWANHHHLAPLYHPDLKLRVEVHRQLFRHNSPFSKAPIFKTNHVLDVSKEVREYDADVFFPPDELNLTYLACHWYWTLMAGVGPHSARALVDAALLLNRFRGGSISQWTTDDAPGTAVAVLMLTLIRQRMVGCREEDLWRCLGSKRNARSRAVRFLAAVAKRRVASMKSTDSPFFAQLMGDWFAVLLDPRHRRSVLMTVAGATASKLSGLIEHKIREVAPGSTSR